MHVLRVIQEYYPQVSGPANQAHYVARGLVAHGHQSSIYTCQLPAFPAAAQEITDGVEITRFASRGPFVSSYVSPRLLTALAAAPADVLHIHCWRSLITDGAILAGRVRRRPVVVQAHGVALGYRHMVSGWRSWPYRVYDRSIRYVAPLRADAVVVATAAERDDCLAYGFPADRIVVIPVGIDPARFPDVSRPKESDPITLLFVGRLSRDRNVLALLHALAYLRTRGHNVRLRLVGRASESTTLNRRGYPQELRALVRDLKLTGQVDFVGERRGAALDAEYTQADIFVYAACYENFGQALLEAAAAGLPLVTTPVGIARELVRDGETGILVEPSGENIGQALDGLLRSPERLAGLGAAGRARVLQEFSWSSIIARYIALYEALVADDRPRRQGQAAPFDNGEPVDAA